MLIVHPICAFNDNYIWLIIHPETRTCAIVDPGIAEPVLQYLEQQSLTPIAILITHHHWDHTNGIAELLSQFPIPIYGPIKDNIPLVDHPITEGDKIILPSLNLNLSILDIPGHTKGHIAYHGAGILLTGDTLFTGGCGRLFEGTPEQMLTSLSKLCALPDETLIYCGHEYTEKNLQFAQIVEPNNQHVESRLLEMQKQRKQNLPTVPASLAIEKQTNPFLRCHLPSVAKAAENYSGKKLMTSIEVFAIIRAWKDLF